MKFLLGGKLVPGYDIKVTGGFQIASEDMSGNSSSTAQAEKGFKPKTLSITTNIKFIDADQLTDLLTLAQGVDLHGERVKYSIVHPLARAMNIRTVRFTDNFAPTPIDGKKAWQVSFSLIEYKSVPEAMQKRQQEPNATAQQAEGSQVGEAATVLNDGWMEKVLQKADNWLAPSEPAS